jgi:spore germination cell wall hydrolase CwlJ-like protein
MSATVRECGRASLRAKNPVWLLCQLVMNALPEALKQGMRLKNADSHTTTSRTKSDLSLQMKTQKRSVLANADDDNDLDVAPSAVCKPTHEEISILAHQIYEEEGCPSGLAEDHWYAAERSLRC